jgi:hypothetical protein
MRPRNTLRNTLRTGCITAETPKGVFRSPLRPGIPVIHLTLTWLAEGKK